MSKMSRARTRWRENRSLLRRFILRFILLAAALLLTAFCAYMAGK
jgi:hypothetical protein